MLHVPSPKNGKDFGYDDIEGGNLLGNLLGSLQEISGNKFPLGFGILVNLADISHMLRSFFQCQEDRLSVQEAVRAREADLRSQAFGNLDATLVLVLLTLVLAEVGALKQGTSKHPGCCIIICSCVQLH